VLSRRPRKAACGCRVGRAHHWRVGRRIDGADVVINLAGKERQLPVPRGESTPDQRSRVRSTRAVGQAIARATRPPRFGCKRAPHDLTPHRYDARTTRPPAFWRLRRECSGHVAFSIDVAKSWEDAVHEFHYRKRHRAASLGSDDEPRSRRNLCVLLRLVRSAGGASGDGRQYVSWYSRARLNRACTG